MLSASTPSFRGDVAWLNEVTTPVIASPAQKLISIADQYGKPINTLADWQQLRPTILQTWNELLGYDPSETRKPTTMRVVETNNSHGITRQLISYETHAGWTTEAFVLAPATSLTQKLPAAVVFHPTVNQSIDEPAGIETGSPVPKDGPRALGLRLAQRGVVAICPRNFLWPTRHQIKADQQATRWLETQSKINRSKSMTGMAKMLFDGQVAVDLLAQLPLVDSSRIAAIGHSLGAKEAIYMAAFDSRIKVAVASEGGIGIKFSNWDAPWYLGQQVNRPNFTHDHHELLALSAPKPVLIVAGESADGDRGWPMLVDAQKIYRQYDPKIRLGQFNHRQGHVLNDVACTRMLDWLTTYL